MPRWTDRLLRAVGRGASAEAPVKRPASIRNRRPDEGWKPEPTTPPPGRRPPRTKPTAERARTIAYAPDLDGAADPGEIVWAWVPYEEDASQGKDRPLLVVGRDGDQLLGLMLSSQHDRADDRGWMPIGTGAWDREGRDSFLRLDRVIEVGEHDIRREGAILDRSRFDRVAAALRDRYGWQ